MVRSDGPALEVYGDPGPRLELVSNTAATDGTATFTRLESNVGVFSIQSGADGATNGPITFGGFQNERMRITADGNVGIGKTDPLNILHLSSDNTSLDASGSARFDEYSLIIHNTRGSASTGTELGMCFNHYDSSYPSSSRTPGAAITHERTDSWSKGKLHFKTKAGADEDSSCNTRMTIDDSGNVGIGTDDPQGNLHISSGTSGDCVLILEADTDNNNEGDNPRIEFMQDGRIAESAILQSDNYLDFKNSVSTLSGIRFFTGDVTSGYTNAVERMRIDPNGDVGIGTVNPRQKLDFGHLGGASIRLGRDHDGDTTSTNRIGRTGTSNDTWYASVNFIDENTNDDAISFNTHETGEGALEKMRISGNGRVGIGTTNPQGKLHIVSPTDGGGTKDLDTQTNCAITNQRDDAANRWMQGINGTNDYLFWYDANGSGIASCKAFFDQDGSNSVDQNFTGQHRTFIKDVPFSQAGNLEGLIVSADNNKYIKMSGGIESGSNAITTNESLPVVSLSTTTNDKKCFGVISVSEDSETRQNRLGNIVSVSQKEEGDTRVYINSVGEGAIWVTDINGPLESGDYITTSNVAGYGQKQDSDSLKNYTVAKITMDCDFEPATQPVQIIRKETSNVNYWVKTTYENVSEEEYSNLEDENRQIIDGVYQKITNEESKTEEEGYELEVRQALVNVLDEHGQLQWEDDPSGATEKAYKIRYLDADGNITDEANHVYKAAFVGCTYHCG